MEGYGEIGLKIYTNEVGLLLQNQLTDDPETWYVALDTQVIQ